MTGRDYTLLPDGEIAVALSDEVTVFAKPLEDFPIDDIYMTWAQGLIYLRCRDYGGGRVEIRDVTLAVIRYSLARVKRAKAGQVRAEREQRERLRKAARYKPKTGSPTPERRKRARDEGSVAQLVAAPKREAASDAAFVYQVPSHMARLHRNGKITNNMLHAASKFHRDWVTAGLVGVRIANLTRVSWGGATDGMIGAVLDARDRIHGICDRLGGFNQPGFQALLAIVGELRTVASWAQDERAGP